MKRSIPYGLLILTGLAFACARDAGSILVKLERPMYNRFYIRAPGSAPANFELTDRSRTTIFDTEQMNSIEASVRGGDVSHRRSQFRIAVVDYNNNGRFDEVGADKFLLEKYGRDSAVLIYPLQPNLAPLKNYTQFRVDRQFYEIAYVDPKGMTLEIYPIGRSEVLKHTVFNTRLPNLPIRDSLGQELRLADLQEPGKPLVIVLWQNRHHIWDYQVEELLNVYRQHPDRLTIIGLHIPGAYFQQPDLKRIHAWLKDRMPLYWGESEYPRELNSSDQLPNLILYDAQGNWQRSGLRAREVLEWISP